MSEILSRGRCPKCKGSGQIVVYNKATGKHDSTRCDRCNGKRYVITPSR